ncbi:MAG: flagellar biosynthesis protein FlhB [Amylibacter sp.]|nr:flagellar biosynthesis protein FlhB [Amylibacter sp.]
MADEEEDKDNKNEEPTEQKLRKAREKGDVPSSQEAGNMTVVSSLLVVVIFILPQVAPDFVQSSKTFIELAGKSSVASGNAVLNDTGIAMLSIIKSLSLGVAPIFATMLIAAFMGIMFQGETVVAVDRIVPKISKISLLGGIKKMFSVDRLVDFLKNVTKVLVIAAIAFVVARDAVSGVWRTQGFVPETLLPYISHAASRLLISAAIFLVPIAIFDIIWKRMQWIKKQRMSIQDIKNEHKDSEGDPKIKARRREIGRKRAQQRIASAVPTADVIITNPTHYAVALKYQMGVDAAPICVAKGADLMAAQIRLLANDNEIPIIENKPLARALHAGVEVDQQVPVEHWQVVAEIIGYVMDLRRNVRRKPPTGSTLRYHDEI